MKPAHKVVDDELAEVETEDFGFLALGKDSTVNIENAVKDPDTRARQLAIANSKGVVAIVIENGFIVDSTASIRKKFEGDDKMYNTGDGGIMNRCPHAVDMIMFSADEQLLLAANIAKGAVYVYDIDSMKVSSSTPLYSFILGKAISDLRPNPAHGNSVAILAQDGSLTHLDIKTNSTSILHRSGITAFEWLLDGNSYLVGEATGEVKVISTSSECVLVIERSSAVQKSHVLYLSCIDQNLYLIIYSTSPSSTTNECEPFLVRVQDESNEIIFSKIYDICMPSSSNSQLCWWYSTIIRHWKSSLPYLIILGSSLSTDISVMTEQHTLYLLDETRRASLPMFKGSETSPTALAIDLTSSKSLRAPKPGVDECPALPLLWCLSGKGQLKIWHVMQMDDLTDSIASTLLEEHNKTVLAAKSSFIEIKSSNSTEIVSSKDSESQETPRLKSSSGANDSNREIVSGEFALEETESLGFVALGKNAIICIDEPATNIDYPVNHLSIGNHNKIFAVVYKNGFIVSKTAELRSKFYSTDKIFREGRKYPLQKNIKAITFTSDEQFFIVITAEGEIMVYPVENLLEDTIKPPKVIDSKTTISDFKCNAADGSSLVVLSMEGTLWHIDISNGNRAKITDGVTCFDWSVENSELITGSKGGAICTWTLQGNMKSSFQCFTKEIFFICSLDENTLFVSAAGMDENEVYVIDVENTKITFARSFDICPSFESTKKPYWYSLVLTKWISQLRNLAIVASTQSPDISVLTSSHSFDILDETKRASMPMLPNGKDSLPAGLALDLSGDEDVLSPKPGIDRCGPVPMVWLLNDQGQIKVWNLIWSDGVENGETEAKVLLNQYERRILTSGVNTKGISSTSAIRSSPEPESVPNVAKAENAPEITKLPEPISTSFPSSKHTPSQFSATQIEFGKSTFGTTVAGASKAPAFGGFSSYASSTTSPFGSLSSPSSSPFASLASKDSKAQSSLFSSSTITSSSKSGSLGFNSKQPNTLPSFGSATGNKPLESYSKESTFSTFGSNKNPESSFGAFAKDSDKNGKSPFGAFAKDSDKNGQSPFGAFAKDSDKDSQSPFGALAKDSDKNGQSPFGALAKDSDKNGQSPFGAFAKDSDKNGQSPFGVLAKDSDKSSSSFGAFNGSILKNASLADTSTVDAVESNKPSFGIFGSKKSGEPQRKMRFDKSEQGSVFSKTMVNDESSNSLMSNAGQSFASRVGITPRKETSDSEEDEEEMESDIDSDYEDYENEEVEEDVNEVLEDEDEYDYDDYDDGDDGDDDDVVEEEKRGPAESDSEESGDDVKPSVPLKIREEKVLRKPFDLSALGDSIIIRGNTGDTKGKNSGTIATNKQEDKIKTSNLKQIQKTSVTRGSFGSFSSNQVKQEAKPAFSFGSSVSSQLQSPSKQETNPIVYGSTSTGEAEKQSLFGQPQFKGFGKPSILSAVSESLGSKPQQKPLIQSSSSSKSTIESGSVPSSMQATPVVEPNSQHDVSIIQEATPKHLVQSTKRKVIDMPNYFELHKSKGEGRGPEEVLGFIYDETVDSLDIISKNVSSLKAFISSQRIDPSEKYDDISSPELWKLGESSNLANLMKQLEERVKGLNVKGARADNQSHEIETSLTRLEIALSRMRSMMRRHSGIQNLTKAQSKVLPAEAQDLQKDVRKKLHDVTKFLESLEKTNTEIKMALSSLSRPGSTQQPSIVGIEKSIQRIMKFANKRASDVVELERQFSALRMNSPSTYPGHSPVGHTLSSGSNMKAAMSSPLSSVRTPSPYVTPDRNSIGHLPRRSYNKSSLLDNSTILSSSPAGIDMSGGGNFATPPASSTVMKVHVDVDLIDEIVSRKRFVEAMAEKYASSRPSELIMRKVTPPPTMKI
ncbi:hypothetical protein V1511DRAFT_503065 [Dipodascopsis uninucleata]